MKKHKISVLTPSYNQGEFIEETIESVLNQNYKNIEHIIIDGGSTDNTVEILRKYPHLKWISEKDNGQSDALNKGLAMAAGEIIGWVNSDDFYEKNIFEDVNEHFNDLTVDWIVGNTADCYELINHIEFTKSPAINYEILLHNPDFTRQPGTFHRKSLLEQAGGLDEEFHEGMDFELWVRLLKISTPKMVNKNYCYFRRHEDQKTSGKNLLQYIRIKEKVLKRENLSYLIRKIILLNNYINVIKFSVKYCLIKLNMIDKKYENIPFSMRKKI